MRWRLCALLVAAPGMAVEAAPVRSRAALTAQQELLRDWALMRCVTKGFGLHTPTGQDAARSAAAVLERGDYGIDSYNRLDVLVGHHLAKVYGGSTGGTYTTLKCVDLYHSPDLDRAVRAERATPLR